MREMADAIQRGRLQGMMTVVRFNWPYYLGAVVVLVGSLVAMVWFGPGWAGALAGLVLAGCLWFLVGSLGVSHWVYDRSDLYRWDWLRRAVGEGDPGEMAVCHTGFDEVSAALAAQYPGAAMRVLDHHDPETMSEPSIRRAREAHPPGPANEAVPFDRWSELTVEVVFALLSIHELRSDAERAAWFAEARRSLGPGGRVVVAEHLRDAANFLAFGPGFLHFHSERAWRHSWEAAGFELADQFCITPFVRVFVLE